MGEIRTLYHHEIECRIDILKANGCSVYLYKDARCDQKLLDETYGTMGWQRTHNVINDSLFCTVEVWDKENKHWVKKQDVGTESSFSKEKGEASDSFKRACVNWGIGRELYSQPFVWIVLMQNETSNNGGKLRLSNKVKFHVAEINYNENRAINHLVIKDQDGAVRFTTDSSGKTKQPTQNRTAGLDKEKEKMKMAIAISQNEEEVKKVWMTYEQHHTSTWFKNITNKKLAELRSKKK